MVFKIEWSARSVKDFENVVTYLEKNWSGKIALEYSGKLDRVLNIIEKMPYLYPKISRRKNVRKCIVVKQNMMFFRVKDKTITILAIFDTRQHPKKLKLK